MARIWPHDQIRELLARAELNGEAKATLEDERSAELFRFAIYAFRKSNSMGLDLCITLDNNVVKIEKKQMPEVVIVE